MATQLALKNISHHVTGGKIRKRSTVLRKGSLRSTVQSLHREAPLPRGGCSRRELPDSSLRIRMLSRRISLHILLRPNRRLLKGLEPNRGRALRSQMSRRLTHLSLVRTHCLDSVRSQQLLPSLPKKMAMCMMPQKQLPGSLKERTGEIAKPPKRRALLQSGRCQLIAMLLKAQTWESQTEKIPLFPLECRTTTLILNGEGSLDAAFTAWHCYKILLEVHSSQKCCTESVRI